MTYEKLTNGYRFSIKGEATSLFRAEISYLGDTEGQHNCEGFKVKLG